MKLLMTMMAASAVLGMASYSYAATDDDSGSSSAKASDLATMPQTQTQKDIDSEITNAKLRAQLGSKSLLSVKTAFGYNGGTVERPSAQIRPAYLGGAAYNVPATMSGTVGVKYSVNAHDSLTLNTGVSVNDPLHGDMSRSTYTNPVSKKQADRAEVYDPSLTFDHAVAIGGIQSITELAGTAHTQSIYTDYMKQAGVADISETLVKEFGKLSLGVTMDANYNLVSSTQVSLASQADGNVQTDWEFGLYPYLEYAINQRYSVRTLVGKIADRVYGQDYYELSRTYQSVGIGIAVTRDIYFYPNIQFIPQDIRADLTNVGVSANVNVF